MLTPTRHIQSLSHSAAEPRAARLDTDLVTANRGIRVRGDSLTDLQHAARGSAAAALSLRIVLRYDSLSLYIRRWGLTVGAPDLVEYGYTWQLTTRVRFKPRSSTLNREPLYSRTSLEAYIF